MSSTCQCFSFHYYSFKILTFLIAPLTDLTTTINIGKRVTRLGNSRLQSKAIGVVRKIHNNEMELKSIVTRCKSLKIPTFTSIIANTGRSINGWEDVIVFDTIHTGLIFHVPAYIGATHCEVGIHIQITVFNKVTTIFISY